MACDQSEAFPDICARLLALELLADSGVLGRGSCEPMHVVCVSEIDFERGELLPDVDGDAGRDLVLVFELKDDLSVLEGGFVARLVELGQAYF